MFYLFLGSVLRPIKRESRFNSERIFQMYSLFSHPKKYEKTKSPVHCLMHVNNITIIKARKYKRRLQYAKLQMIKGYGS